MPQASNAPQTKRQKSWRHEAQCLGEALDSDSAFTVKSAAENAIKLCLDGNDDAAEAKSGEPLPEPVPLGDADCIAVMDKRKRLQRDGGVLQRLIKALARFPDDSGLVLACCKALHCLCHGVGESAADIAFLSH